jgi:hypothetical protein
VQPLGLQHRKNVAATVGVGASLQTKVIRANPEETLAEDAARVLFAVP